MGNSHVPLQSTLLHNIIMWNWQDCWKWSLRKKPEGWSVCTVWEELCKSQVEGKIINQPLLSLLNLMLHTMTETVLMRMCMTELLVIHIRLRVLITLLIISFPLAWDTQELKVLLFSVKQEGGTDSFLCHDNQTWALISPPARHIIQRTITTITTAFLKLVIARQYAVQVWLLKRVFICSNLPLSGHQ